MPSGRAISEVVLAKQKFLFWLTIHQVKSDLKKTAQLEDKSTAATTSSTAGGAAAHCDFFNINNKNHTFNIDTLLLSLLLP